MKRQDYISWDEYFMGVAILAAQRSKDPSTQVGACIVSGENDSSGGNVILSTAVPTTSTPGCAKARPGTRNTRMSFTRS